MKTIKVVIIVPDDPRLHGYLVDGEPQADGSCIVDDPIEPGTTLRLMPGEWLDESSRSS